MKQRLSVRITPACLLAVVLAVAAAATLSAQTSLQAQLAVRPLSRDDITIYKLAATTQTSAGLSTVGVGQPAYLEAQINLAIPASDIAGVAWELSSKPANSKAVLADSPLGPDVAIWEPSDRLISQAASRKLLRPDVVGQYTVTATITTATSGTATVTRALTAGTYMGIKTCTPCHSIGAAPKVPSWSKTAHGNIFKEGVDGGIYKRIGYATYPATCFPCHTVAYDTDPAAVNGGFDDLAAQLKWTPPTVLKEGNFAAMPDALKNVANIQCENCHGPGSQHAATGNRAMISASSSSGVCGVCHNGGTHHVKNAEWNNSTHAVARRSASGEGHEACVGCHTGGGFVARVKGARTVSTDYSAITCGTCHEPHGQTTPGNKAHLIRMASVKLADETVVENAGLGALCMNCHQSRQNGPVYAANTPGSARFGPHHGPQADMLVGTNGFTYGLKIPSSAHGDVVEDTCVTCHMQAVDATDPSLTHVGGHTFRPSLEDGTTLYGACQKCHGPDLTSFDFPLLDYDGDGVIDGVQTEVRHLLDKLSALLPPAGEPKAALTISDSWTQPQLQAAYNWLMVTEDGSRGIHNMAYTVGLLKASIADLSGKK